jgi:hypothetical protein
MKFHARHRTNPLRRRSSEGEIAVNENTSRMRLDASKTQPEAMFKYFVCCRAAPSTYLSKETAVVSNITKALLIRMVLKDLQLLLAGAGCKDAGSPGEECRERNHPG